MTEDAVRAESVGVALLVVLGTLTPAERLAFVLHDMFAVPYDDIAPIIGRSAGAARQLASRARRRVQGKPELLDTDAHRQRELVTAFLAASRAGDFEALLEMLDPGVVLRADGAAASRGVAHLVRGAAAVAANFSGRAAAARVALVDGVAGAVWTYRGEPQVIFRFTFDADRIVEIELLGDADHLREVELTRFDG